MIIHQTHNTLGYDIFNAFVYENVNWFQHIHKSFEIAFVMKGEVKASVNGKDYILKENDFLLIPPFSMHGFDGISKNSITYIAVFSNIYIESFINLFQNKTPTKLTFTLNEKDRDYFIYNMNISYSLGQTTNVQKCNIKKALFIVLTEFVKNANFIENSNKSEFVFEVIKFIEENYENDISLSLLAKKLGYDYMYLSRILNSRFNMSFNDMVNQYRVEKAIQLIKNHDYSLTDISVRCGFPTIRSFNRIFKKITGVTPSVFRK